jgi:PAS domain S-box-containing protein
MRQQLRKIALRTAIWYGLIAAAWFLVTDQFVAMFVPAGRTALLVQTLKDWFFVCLSAWLLYRLLQKLLEHWEQAASRQLSAEHARRHSDDRFRQFADALSDLAWIARADGSGLYFNRRWKTYFGKRDDNQTPDLFPAEVIHPNERTHFLARRNLAMETATPLRTELRMRRHDGMHRWFEFNLLPLRDQGGQVLGWFGIHTDIHDQRDAAVRASESELRNRTLLEALVDGVFVAQDHRFVYCNPALPAMLGYTAEEFVGLRFDQVLSPEFLPLWMERFDKRVSTGPGEQEPAKHYEVRWMRRNGESSIWVELLANRIEYNQAPAVLGIVRDVTARKRAETAQLHSQKLEALGTLAGGIAHDFNNILLAISGNTRLAKEDLDAANPAQESLDEIAKATRRATELVQRILAFGRSQEQQRQVMTLQPVVEEALALVRATLPSSISLRATFAADVPPVLGDATQIHQVIVNLATNAAHAVGAAGGVIEFSLTCLEVESDLAATIPGLKPGRYARLAVADNGSGMDRATLERIFDPFFTTKPMGEGTGLGLATVHGIVKSHDGAITVYSQPAKGTTFQVYFPAAAGSVTPKAEESLRPRASRGGHVLYVDDDHDLVFLMRRLLDRLGYRVSSFTHPHEALAAFEASPHAFDVVVTDLTMPGLSGFDLASRMSELRPDLPVVVTSGYVRPEDQENARNAGARTVILKPNTIDELAELLEKLLDKPD